MNKRYIPFARTDTQQPSECELAEYIGIDKFMKLARKYPPEIEFRLLIEMLVEFSGNVWDAYCRAMEMWVPQAATSYEAHSKALIKLKTRIHELWGLKRNE